MSATADAAAAASAPMLRPALRPGSRWTVGVEVLPVGGGGPAAGTGAEWSG
ncbi:hypothetical protein ACFH04_03695 [Streptomyces noboritoensis]|uniref:Uncharacterized protein n=1 Tax=Streptomyces noboritoensis TaxID=67337 RepID=A0ABV6TAQ4_9ACTN